MGRGKWEPWHNLDEFQQQMERLFIEARNAKHKLAVSGYVWAPLADVQETPQAIIVQVELPGIRPEQVVVELVDGDLVVRGERPFDRCEAEDPSYIIMERAHGTFARRFALPPGVDGEAITADLAEGLLTVVVPKCCAKSPARFTLIVE
ncbi:MAG: Hsp20/alpha crystallin family protein [Humidesulfovibrio sp.]|nr:Hsp20/alpha crystallin family protein [Humidesulfovibrio sp.]